MNKDFVASNTVAKLRNLVGRFRRQKNRGEKERNTPIPGERQAPGDIDVCTNVEERIVEIQEELVVFFSFPC